MNQREALEIVAKIVKDGLSPQPLSGSWRALLNIKRALDQLEPTVELTQQEADHLAAIIPAVGSSAVDITELDWFETHGEALVQKLTRQ